MEETMSDIIGADAAKLAGLQIDTLQKVRSGKITLEQWEWFNKLSFSDREKLLTDHPVEGLLPQKPAALLAEFYKVASTVGIHATDQRIILGTFPKAQRGWKTNQDKLDRMTLFIRICDLATKCYPSKSSALFWLRQSIPAAPFCGSTPLKLILRGHYSNLYDTYNFIRTQAGIGRSSLV
jgi:hypothetical protein